MTDDSSSWPREGSLADIDFHTPSNTLAGSSRIRQNPSGRFEAMPPLREPASGHVQPPFLPRAELPQPRRRDSGAFRPASLSDSPMSGGVASTGNPAGMPASSAQEQRETASVALPAQGGWLMPTLMGAGILAAASIAIWLLLH